jgi:NAD(P)-dependent dehydrogenase (short-subunit alcohol dehydrogenase family)/acyl dehydratase/predicted lipid carrier protein YhbT
MSDQLRFDGKVVIITGAGNGLGKQHALMFGSRGAHVVVNDLGGGIHGGGKSSAAADAVVEEIKKLGGKAVANYDSVEDGDSIVKTAIDAFGTVDIVVNNAGILRDVSFQKMTREDWELIMKVHLNGAFRVTHAAWPYMRDKEYGRIIFTTSGAGIYGNFGQANYSAAKLALLGLANTLVVEGRNKNILVNTIAPIAASRLTETVMPPELLAVLKPEYISPLVGWLCHESCEETGGLFEVGAGYMSKLRWERTLGHTFKQGSKWDIEQVAGKWSKITDFTNAEHPTSTNDTVTAIMSAINSKSYGGNEFLDLDAAFAAENTIESSYTENDLALYALGVGAAQDPLNADELKYVYELNDQFSALPTYAVMPPSNAMLAMGKEGKSPLPGMNYGLDRLLHGEQYTEIKRPLPRNGKFKHTFKLKAAYDKNPNAVLVIAITTRDESGEEIAYNEFTSFVRGAGGWGGDRGPAGDVNVPPAREPDLVIEEKTLPNQTLFYRLCGDWNPLHADPDFAKAFGYDKPILHGLCSYGILGRQVVKAFCNNDPRKFKSLKVRFAETVFPGETLVTRMWKESDLRIICEVRVKERDKLVIKNAAVELFDQIPVAKPKPKAAVAAAAAAPAQSDEIISADLFNGLAKYIAANPGIAKEVKTSFQFTLTNPESNWALDLKTGEGSCTPTKLEKPDVTVQISEEDMIALFMGKADAQKLYFGGKLKIGGNIMASNKLTILQKVDAKLFEEAKAERLAKGGGAVPPTAVGEAAPAQSDEIISADLFNGLAAYVAANPQIAKEVKTSFQFKLKDPDSVWALDLKTGDGSCTPTELAKPDVTVQISEDDMIALFMGKADAQKLYFGGKLKITGNIMASNKLTILQKVDPKLFDEAKAKRLGGGAAAAPKAAAPAASTAAPKAGKSGEIFAALAKRLESDAKSAKALSGSVLQFNVRDPEASWTVDLSDKTAKVMPGGSERAAAVFGIDDEDLLNLVGGADPRALYQQGKLRVDGDVRLAHQLPGLLTKLV